MEHKKIIFLGLLYDKDEEDYLLKNAKTGLQGAANTFQWSLINGLASVLTQKIDIISSLPMGVFPKYFKKLTIKDSLINRGDGAECRQIGFINLPFVKQFKRKRAVINEISGRIKNNPNTELYVFCYSLYSPYIKALLELKKKWREKIKIIIIVPDLHGKYGVVPRSFIKRIAFNIRAKGIYKVSDAFDYYVLLTEQMKYPLRIENKPFVVVEGIADLSSFKDSSEPSDEEKVILYTGTIDKQFGVQRLLQAFEMIKEDDYRLIICGSGDTEPEILRLSEADKRIRFLGFVGKEKVRSLQSKAMVLVNPRIDDAEYVKYSFPSKTMEYLLSGNPVIMNRLSGVPDEYYDYIFSPDDDSAESLAETIRSVCEMSFEERKNIGKQGKEFIETKKSSQVQAKKIIDMLDAGDEKTLGL